jgi:hypothetical protein
MRKEAKKDVSGEFFVEQRNAKQFKFSVHELPKHKRSEKDKEKGNKSKVC